MLVSIVIMGVYNITASRYMNDEIKFHLMQMLPIMQNRQGVILQKKYGKDNKVLKSEEIFMDFSVSHFSPIHLIALRVKKA